MSIDLHNPYAYDPKVQALLKKIPREWKAKGDSRTKYYKNRWYARQKALKNEF